MQCFFPKTNTFQLSVTLLDDVERLFKIPIKQKASVALGHIVKFIPVTYIEYFGLKYLDRFQKSHWINMEKPLYKQLKKSQIERPKNANEKCIFHYSVMFEVRYYPRDPTSIDDEAFRYQVFLQIRKDLMANKLTIKDESIVSILCALILQSDFGDYDSNRFAPHYIRQTISSHLLSSHIEDQIRNEHIKLRGMEPIEAEYQFLEKARWLDNYGTIIFPVKDNNNRNCYLGLNPQGFALRYYKESNLKYDIFWPRICAIRRKGRQFMIKEKTEKIITHRFETGEKGLCKVLNQLSEEHFSFFKLKKDEKPLVKAPVKRTFGKSSSKEFGYNSDTSDGNQYSDDTLSSYPDSINTTQSTKISKSFKKTSIPIRNCVSDAEESAFSKKNRKVIVCKRQKETEEEIEIDEFHQSNYFHSLKSDSITPRERIPPDFRYENRLNKPLVNIQSRQKRLRKKVEPTSEKERKIYDHCDSDNFTRKAVDDPALDEDKYQISYRVLKRREVRYQITRSKSGDRIENKARIRRKLPSTGIIPYSFDLIQNGYSLTDQRLVQSASVDSIITLKTKESLSTPSKRLLPNIANINANHYSTPPVPKHRLLTKQEIPINLQNRPQSLYTDNKFKPGFLNVPPRIPQKTTYNQYPSDDVVNVQSEQRTKITSKSYLNYIRKSIPETGI